MGNELAGKFALVTGASKGIGAGIATAFGAGREGGGPCGLVRWRLPTTREAASRHCLAVTSELPCALVASSYPAQARRARRSHPANDVQAGSNATKAPSTP